MFRRRRVAVPSTSWPPPEDGTQPDHYGTDHHGARSRGPGDFGPDGVGPGGLELDYFASGSVVPGGFGPDDDYPPLAAHDPFGGWPAFADDSALDPLLTPVPAGPAPGYRAPARAAPEEHTPAGPPPWARAPAGPPATHHTRAPAAHPAAPPGPHTTGSPATHPTAPPGTHSAAPPAPNPTAPPAPNPSEATATHSATPPAPHPTPADPGLHEADPHGAVPDWLPLLTHPIDDQCVQPDPEVVAAPSEPPSTGPPKRRAGRHPRAPRQSATESTSHPTPSPHPTPPPHLTSTSHTTPPPHLTPTPHATPTPHLTPPHPTPTPHATPTPRGTPDPAEAAALAGAFAADYLSWDQDNPDRRGQVLAQYLPAEVTTDPMLLGWSGKGRQRAEFALPGAVHPDGEGRVLVDVRVRVTPFRQVGPAPQDASSPSAGLSEVAGVPAVAPAPSARGWRSQDSYWVRLTVPVIRDHGRLVVDTWDEQLGQDAPRSAPRRGTADDPSTADDADDLADAVLANSQNGIEAPPGSHGQGLDAFSEPTDAPTTKRRDLG